MNRRITGAGSLAGLLALACLGTPAVLHAQDAQQNETDLAFINRISARLKVVERRAGQLEEYIQELSRQDAQNDFMGRNQNGRQESMSSQDRQGDYRRAEMRMRSAGKNAVKEREKLVELQRAGNGISDKQRNKIESAVGGLDRKIAHMERDIQQRRL